MLKDRFKLCVSIAFDEIFHVHIAFIEHRCRLEESDSSHPFEHESNRIRHALFD
jgi:hypothetical protein